MFERMEPRTLVKWLIFAAIVYLLLPYDLIPDFFGLPGRFDDVLVMGWLAWIYLERVRAVGTSGAHQESAGRSEGGRPRSASSSSDPVAFDPYEVLGVPPSASSEAIRLAYRSRMQEYHPDKVAHLGAELQSLAHEKCQQIQRAYRQLSG